MNVEASPLADLEAGRAGRGVLSDDVRVLACPDLVSVGMLGESVRSDARRSVSRTGVAT